MISMTEQVKNQGETNIFVFIFHDKSENVLESTQSKWGKKQSKEVTQQKDWRGVRK